MKEEIIKLAKDLRNLGDISVTLPEWKNEVNLQFLLDIYSMQLKLCKSENAVMRSIYGNLKKIHDKYCNISK